MEEKEKQLLSLEYDFHQTKERLSLTEKEKVKLEEDFVSEILGLQTKLDQKLLQIEKLDRRNSELVEAKKQFEEMVEQYKQYSDDCKRETREVRKAKQEEIEKLKDKLAWQKEEHLQEKNDLLGKVDAEKIAMEQTIRELMYRNKVE